MKIFKRVTLFLVGLVVIGGITLAALTEFVAPINPQSWKAPPNPGLTGDYAPNDKMSSLELIPMPGVGPEDIACSADGTIYSGLYDGTLLRWTASNTEAKAFANTGGRPLGMKVDASGNLIVADADKGLLKVSPSGEIEVLADKHDGKQLLFVDDLDIATDGTIWFSDASTRFGYHEYLLDFYEGSMTGRLLSYSPASGKTTVHLDGLFFANGVTLGPNDSYVLVAETGLGRIQRFWLQGDKAGQSDVFIEHLPGTPDNINFDGNDTIWIAMPSARKGVDDVAELPFLRKIVSILPRSVQESAAVPLSFVVGVDTSGKITENLQDRKLKFRSITSATPCGNMLWFGNLVSSAVARLPL